MLQKICNTMHVGFNLRLRKPDQKNYQVWAKVGVMGLRPYLDIKYQFKNPGISFRNGRES